MYFHVNMYRTMPDSMLVLSLTIMHPCEIERLYMHIAYNDVNRT
jgi:hypothetical protein